MVESTKHLHVCTLCEAACGLQITVDDGNVSLIRGDRDDVASHGFLCPKGTALKDLQNDADRLRRPLRKRDGIFVEISFEEAFAEIERRLLPIREAGGPASTGLVIGNPVVHRTGLVLYIEQLASALGSPNVFTSASLDQMPKHLSVGRMFGDFYSIPVPDIDRTDLLVIIGANPVVSNGSMWSVPDFRGRARALAARGGRMVTVDPRFTETSAIADLHLPIRPGGDVFFLAALVHVLFRDGLVRLGRLEEFVTDVDPIRASVARFTPETAANRCGIPAADIEQLAHELGTTERAVVYGRLGTCLQEHGTLTSWLIDVVNVLTGHLDEPGGSMFATPPAFAGNTTGPAGMGIGVATGTYASRVSGVPEVMNQFPLACLAEEIETEGEGQIKALMMLGSNAVLSSPDGPRLAAALDQLDFLVCLDIYLNETTSHADLIIPGPSVLEESHYDVFFSQFSCRNHARFSPATLTKPAEIPQDWETMVRLIGILRGESAEVDLAAMDDALLIELLGEMPEEERNAVVDLLSDRTGAERRVDLGLRTGPYGDWFGINPDGILLASLEAAPSGVDFGPLVSRIPELLRTPSGRIEMTPPDFIEALHAAADELDDEAPECVIIGRRHLRSNNSWLHNLPVLAKGRFRCTLLIHPGDAAEWGIDDGSLADVAVLDGSASIKAMAEHDESMMRGVVSLPHGWGHVDPAAQLGVASRRPGASLNVLTDANRRDPLSGNAALNGQPVVVRPADESSAPSAGASTT